MERREDTSSLSARLPGPLSRLLRPRLKTLLGRVRGDGPVHHIAQGFDLADLTAELERHQLSYALLDLNPSGSGSQPVLLLDDDAMMTVEGMLSPWPTGQTVAIYSVTGLPGYAFSPPGGDGGMALFPPYLARSLLAAAERGSGRVEGREAFLARAYALTYLAGGSADAASVDGWDSDGAPAKAMEAEAARLGIQLAAPVTLEAIETVLADNGWRPPMDVLERAAGWNGWLRDRFFGESHQETEEPGLSLFFVRRKASEDGLEPSIIRLLESGGFEILETIPLEGELAQKVTNSVRGGNWGRGPWPVSGGPPASIIVAFDVIPLGVSQAEGRRHPGLDNGRILAAKEAVRMYLNENLPAEARFNAVHSTDNSRQSLEVLRGIPAVDVDALLRLIDDRRRDFATHHTVIETLTRHGKRAKVELIEYNGTVAVKKTYRHQALRFLQREVAFQAEFSALRPEVLPVLETGPNYFISPHIEDVGAQHRFLGITFPRLLSLKDVRQLADFIRFLLARGYDPIDLTPWNNVLIDRTAGLKAIDFEFVYRNPDGRIVPEKSMCLTGLKDEFPGDYPYGVFYLKNPYATEWYPRIGLDLTRFLRGATWKQQPLRYINFGRYVVRWTIRGVLRSESNSIKAIIRRVGRQVLRRKAKVAATLDKASRIAQHPREPATG
ncbi:hypothetical protein [Microvirga pudoricolor]|uniref:hypothetical protein n=1 Tax=Microvirga pudoricolor TaxID=2778729 RepID=UPI0019527488|nr:hypothetical protein [Microvirga pudoricolor]MBM6595655.1 hypothetical protein [Microvirga pudoricolor]